MSDATETKPLTYQSDRLIWDWRQRYASRRTVAWQMLNDAEVLVRDAIARELEQERRQAKTERDWALERRERAVELAESRHEQQLDRLRRQVAEAEAKIASLSPRQTLMREERETVEDGTVVRLLAPTVPSYGDKSSPRPWMLGEIEDVVHRLRMGGANEGTELRFKRDAIEACVPFAEFALAPAAEKQFPTIGRSAPTSTGWSMQRVAVALIAAIVLVILILVVAA